VQTIELIPKLASTSVLLEPSSFRQTGESVGAVPLVGGYDQLANGLASHRMRSLFASAAWAQSLSATYGFHVKASTLTSAGQVRAAIPFSEIDDIRGPRIVSLPFSDYCDPMVEDAATWDLLIQPILAMGLPVRFRCLHNEIPLADPRFTHTTAAWHAADLTPPEEAMWSAVKRTGRDKIRKAARHGLVAREGRTMDDVRAFYRMHCHTRKSKYGLFAQPFAFFENLYASFAHDDRFIVMLAEINGAPVAGTVFLIDGDALYYKFNASLDQSMGPNHFLIWNGMLLGKRLGLSRLDFGLSDMDQPGLIRFKRKFATQERTISQLRWLPPDYADAREQQAGQVLHNLTKLFTLPDVPDEVTCAAGNELYRFFC
jgi:Acetyltransferase (GNAT) domain